ncbi:MAG: hypothetical protein ACPGVU_12355 [Limisphaerales bacterium]
MKPVLLATLLFVSGIGRAQEMRDEVSYSNDIKPLVENFCTTCHAGDEPDGDMVLSSYAAVRKQVEKGELLQRINDGEDPMPEDGLLPKYMRRLFQLWKDGGFINVGKKKSGGSGIKYAKFTPPNIEPIDINQNGFDLLRNMQGHWVGSLNLMGQDYEWWAFDYRAISPSHVHGMFEGGTVGNLFTSFFVANFKGKRTIMARNGGILNGIYRTSYFVLDRVQQGRGWSYYRLVDAYGGAGIMYMELTFSGDQLEFNSYTSRFGLTAPPKRHMSFKGQRMHPELAANAARDVGFPKNVVAFDLSHGLPKPDWGKGVPQSSASYLSQEVGKSLVELGKRAKDPIRIDQMPHVATLKVSVERTAATRGKKLQMYLSGKALTDRQGRFVMRYGYVREELLNTLLLFPEISGKQDEFTFTYLHPGKYFLTVVADMDEDGLPSPGDIAHPRREINVRPKSDGSLTIRNLNVRN